MANDLPVLNGDFEELSTFNFHTVTPLADWDYIIPQWTIVPEVSPAPYGGAATVQMNDPTVLDAFGDKMAAGIGGYFYQTFPHLFLPGYKITFTSQVGHRTDRLELDYAM